MLFDTYVLCSYNKVMKNLMTNCKCYNFYKCGNFVDTIVEHRASYMACLCYGSQKRNRVSHKAIPIILGSKIDSLIRGNEALRECYNLWGAKILRGVLIIYPNFSTFDSLSMHIRQTKNCKSIDWFMYVKDEGFALSYTNKAVTWTYKRESYTGDDGWASLLAESNPFNTEVVPSDYVQMFDTMLRSNYSMNDLKNRQIINPAMAITKYIQYDLMRRMKQKTAGCQKLTAVFEAGNLYPAFNKKNAVDPDENSRQYNKSYHNTLHEGRSDKIKHLAPNVVRSSNAAIRNSNALSFPKDAIGYFCMLNMKDLKSAGEQNVLADMVIMTEETDQLALYKYIKSISIASEFCSNISNSTSSSGSSGSSSGSSGSSSSSNNNSRNDTNILSINGYLIGCHKLWTLDDLINVKRQFPNVTTQYFPPYVILLTKACIPIKYCEKFDCFFRQPKRRIFKKLNIPKRICCR